MAVHRKFVESMQVEAINVPKDITGAAQTGDYVSLKQAAGVAFIIQQGAWAGGNPNVTFKQATDVGNTNSDAKTLSFTEGYRKVGISNTQWTRFTVTSDTFALGTTANTVTLVEIGADQLDRDGGFDCVQLNLSTPGANADLLSALAVLYGVRNQGDATVILAPATTD